MTTSPRVEGQLKVNSKLGKTLPTAVPRELIAEKILEHRGNLSKVCDDLNILYIPLQEFIDKNYELRDLVIGCRSSLTDEAEEVIRVHLGANNLKAAIFILTTLGKDLGYVPKMETQSHTVHEERGSVDLTNLSPKDLRSLRKIMKEAQRGSQIIDVTPTRIVEEE